jgi:hypothetical protein
MLNNVVEACCTDVCDFCAKLSCLKSNLKNHRRSLHGECMLLVMYSFINKFNGTKISIHPHFTLKTKPMVHTAYLKMHMEIFVDKVRI